MENKITIKELSVFLEKANKSTYANKNAKKVKSSKLKSSDYYFKDKNLIYHDTYFGARDFIGGEILYKNKIPVWGMNYYGYILDKEIKSSIVYDFLRLALIQKSKNIIPVRGNKLFKKENLKYVNKVFGKLERFVGKEEIYYNKKVVYRCDYHGGFCK